MNENLKRSYKYKISDTRDVKFILPFAIIFLSALFIGAFLPRFLSDAFLISQARVIALHFEIPIAYSEDTYNTALNSILRSALVDICCLFVIFVFSFSASHFVICGIVLVYVGIRNGCIASLTCVLPSIISTHNSLFTSAPKTIELCIFLAAKAIIVLLIIRYILFAVGFAVRFNEKEVSSSETLKFILASLSCAFSLSFVHGAYGFLIKNI